VALRDRLSDAITDDHCPPGELAPLTRQLRDVLGDLRELDTRQEHEAEQLRRGLDEAWDQSAI
jgi:hypothetical protein